MGYLNKKYIGLMPDRFPQEEEENTRISYPKGLPRQKEISTAYNGAPFSIEDINKLSNISINNNLLFNTGSHFNTFDKKFCEQIGGYPKNAILVFQKQNGFSLVRSLVDDNTIDFTENGIDGINWIEIEDEISIVRNRLFEKIQEVTVPRADLIGTNMNKWIKVADISVPFIGTLFRTIYSQTGTGNRSLDTCFIVSADENMANTSPGDFIENSSRTHNDYFISKQLYSTSYLRWTGSSGSTTWDLSCMSFGDVQEIFITPSMYGTLWVKNVNYVSADLRINIYLGQI